MTKKILIVEDEERLASWIKTYAERDGYECYVVGDGLDALDFVATNPPDLILLDIMLPKLDGWAVCEHIRKYSDIPIIMLTARIAEQDIVKGLKIGADDYVKKPFSPIELLARIEANLRRTNHQQHIPNSGSLETLYITLELDTHECIAYGKSVDLTANQFDLLAFFMQHPLQVFSRDQLIDHVFGLDYDSYERAIDVHIRRLRMKIEPDPSTPKHIQTVFGTGYKFVPD